MKKGFSVLEALIVVIIFTILFGLVFEILATGRRSGDIGTILQDVQVQAKQGLENMVRELYESSASKITPSPPFTNSINIAFQVPVGFDSDGDLVWGADGQANYGIMYQMNDYNQLIRYVINPYPNGATISESEKVLANFVQSLSFSLAQSSNILTISLTATRTSLSGLDLSSALTSAVYLRN